MHSGKGSKAVILALILFCFTPSFGQQGKILRYRLSSNPQRLDVVAEDNSVLIDYSIPELSFESIINETGSFYRLSIPGHVSTVVPGKPELPVLSRLISVPENSGIRISITEVKYTRISPKAKKIEGLLYPAQEGRVKDPVQDKQRFYIDRKEYDIKGIIKSDTVAIDYIGTARGKRLANLYISPVRYNPASNEIEVITSMKIRLTFVSNGDITAGSKESKSFLFNQALNKGVLDFNPSEVIPGYSTQPVQMIILTDTIFRKQLQPLLRWKTQKGFRLKVLYRGTGLAGNTYVQLKDTLTRIYKTSAASGIPPEYLLIVGDVNKVPYYGVQGGSSNVTDMYYGEFDGNGDYIPEMFIGRLPVADTSELRAVVGKIIQYEKFQYADTNKFYSRALVTAGNDATYAIHMNGQVKYATSNYLNPSHGINSYAFYYPQSTSLTVTDSIKKIFNNGLSFLNYTGHGAADGWLFTQGSSSFYLNTNDIASLTNRNMYPFVISNACRTSQFNLSNSFGNKIVTSAERGAIGFIGCSNDSYWDEDVFWAVGACTPSADPTYQTTGHGAYDRLFHSHSEPASEWYYTMGQVNYSGNLAVSSTTSSRKKYYWETYNLVGDPSMIPILGKPEKFTATLPDTLPNRIRTVTINTDPFAYVAVSHNDTLWDASFANPSGSVMLDLPERSNDSCLFVITGQNRIPLIKKVRISNVKREFINLTSYAVNDILGNNNGIADFDEPIYVKLTINNLGLTDASNLYAKISSTSKWVTVKSDSVRIGNLAAGAQVVLDDDLELKVSGEIPDMETVTINLLLKDAVSERRYILEICIHAPKLEIYSCTIDDSVLGNNNHIADPGETFNLMFKVRNLGSSNASGQFSITSPGPEISIPDPNVKSGLLKFGEVTNIPVMVKLSDQALAGDYFNIFSRLDCSPFIVEKRFTFRAGKIRESFEAFSFNVFPWINISKTPWIITSGSSVDGNFSAQSGPISHNGTTTLMIRTIYPQADSLRFSYHVSCENEYDNFIFKLNGTEVLRSSGEVPWTRKSLPVPAGMNKMEWIYKKDNSVSQGSDCAWIDMIDFAGPGSLSYIQKDLLVARISSPVIAGKYGQETVSVNVLNIGRDTLNGFNLSYMVNGHAPVDQFFSDKVIPYGDTLTVSFKAKADLSKYGIYDIIAYSNDNNDNYNLNDTAYIRIENTEITEPVRIYPNPFTDRFTLFIQSKVSEKIRIIISNSSGAVIRDIERKVDIGRNELEFSDIDLLPSLYIMTIKGTGINKSLTLIKMKAR